MTDLKDVMKVIETIQSLEPNNESYRLQIVVGDILMLEYVGTLKEVYDEWHRWVDARYRDVKPAGGALIKLASLPRVWNVNVGSTITEWDGKNQIPDCGNKD